MAEKPKEQVEMASDPEEDDLDDLDGTLFNNLLNHSRAQLTEPCRCPRPIRSQTLLKAHRHLLEISTHDFRPR